MRLLAFTDPFTSLWSATALLIAGTYQDSGTTLAGPFPPLKWPSSWLMQAQEAWEPGAHT